MKNYGHAYIIILSFSPLCYVKLYIQLISIFINRKKQSIW